MIRDLQQEFEAAFNRLDAEQQAAVMETEGPVQVVAGPGSGKTEILCLRIGRILLVQDCHPSNILCLTFSRAAVETIRERLRKLIGSTADMVEVHTFHSFSHKLLREKGGQLLRHRKLISRAQQSMVLSRLLFTQFAEADPRQLKPTTASVINSYLQLFSHLSREGIDLPDLEEQAAAWGADAIACIQHLSGLQTAYTKTLEERNLITFDDLLVEAILLLSDLPDVLAAVREKYTYLLVDEFQDTNPLQLQLIRLLTAGEISPNFFAVGDENQSIYRFQGAGTQQFNWMAKHFQTAGTFQLMGNYRSIPPLAKAFKALASMLSEQAFDEGASQSSEQANGNDHMALVCRLYQNSDDEARGTALLVQQLMQQGRKGTTAVLARKHQELQTVAGYLYQLGIPFRYNRQENNLLQSHFGQCLHNTLQFLHLRGLDNYMSEGYLCHALLHKQEGKQLLQLFMEQRQQTQIRLFEWLGASGNRLSYLPSWYTLMQSLLWRQDETLSRETLNILQSVVTTGLRMAPTSAEATAWAEWLEHFLETDNQKTLRSLAAMISYQVQQHIAIPVNLPPHETDEAVVTLSTIHAAKGLGFSMVLLVGCQSANWEDAPHADVLPIPLALKAFIYPEASTQDDLARLFYVACTRAGQALHCSCHEEDGKGSSALLQPLLDWGMEIQDHREKHFNMPPVKQYKVEADDAWNTLVEERCARYALSPTGTHHWSDCQNRFFITQLIKVPGMGSEATAFGNLMHEVLKMIGKQSQLQHQSGWLEDTINRLFKTQWFRFHPLHLDAYRRYALWLLPRYLEKHPLPEKPVLVEKAFQQVSPAGMRIKGILDRVEVDGDRVRMIDYKTGRRRDPLEPFGDNNNPGSAYWRQGMIYAGIMQSVYPDVQTFEFAFHYLEDEAPEEVLAVAPHAGLDSWLHKVWEEILALRLKKSCGDPDCIYCQVMETVG
jgi:DNA helicase II / ATP-dependent DNA helicase PcrA